MDYKKVSNGILLFFLSIIYVPFMFELWGLFKLEKSNFIYSLYQYFVFVSAIIGIVVSFVLILIGMNRNEK